LLEEVLARTLLFPVNGTNTVKERKSMLSDTHPNVAAMQREMFRRMTKEERLRLTLDLCDEMRDLALGGLRHRRPQLSEADLQRELNRMLYGSSFPR
jgi:hypothetical protein